MEQTIATLVPTIGFGGVACVYLWKYINKKDEQNRQDTKEQILELRKENKEEKNLFRSSIDSFNKAIDEFKNVQKETNTINSKITTIEKDISEIKTKIENKRVIQNIY